MQRFGIYFLNEMKTSPIHYITFTFCQFQTHQRAQVGVRSLIDFHQDVKNPLKPFVGVSLVSLIIHAVGDSISESSSNHYTKLHAYIH